MTDSLLWYRGAREKSGFKQLRKAIKQLSPELAEQFFK